MPDKNTEKKHHFINEKIIRPRLTRLQVVRRLLFWGIGAVLFGFLAAVTFVVSEPWARRYLSEPETVESSSVSIPKENSPHSCLVAEDNELVWKDVTTGESFRRESLVNL